MSSKEPPKPETRPDPDRLRIATNSERPIPREVATGQPAQPVKPK